MASQALKPGVEALVKGFPTGQLGGSVYGVGHKRQTRAESDIAPIIGLCHSENDVVLQVRQIRKR